jgi:hypothetical protein
MYGKSSRAGAGAPFFQKGVKLPGPLTARALMQPQNSSVPLSDLTRACMKGM